MATAHIDAAPSPISATLMSQHLLAYEHRRAIALGAALSLTLHLALVLLLTAASGRFGYIDRLAHLLSDTFGEAEVQTVSTPTPISQAIRLIEIPTESTTTVDSPMDAVIEELGRGAATFKSPDIVVQPPAFAVQFDADRPAAAQDIPSQAIATETLERSPRRIEMAPLQQLALEQRIAAALADETASDLTWNDGANTYRAQINRSAAVGDTELEQVTVNVSTASSSGAQLHTKLTFNRLAFSQFSQVIDRWDPNVQLHDDEVIGRFHSNSSFYVGLDSSAVPKFAGKVTTAARGFKVATNATSRRRSEMFQGGLQTFTGRINLPQHTRPTVDETDTDSQVMFFTRDTHVTFRADGTFALRDRSAPSERTLRLATDKPVYLVATDDASIYVKGVVDGCVLVYSPQRIVIEGSLTYASNPRTQRDSDDFLGLVSDKSVEVARAAVVGRGDLMLEAAIFARRRFVVRDIDFGRPAVMFIYGSLTAGSVSATEPRYATKIEFDPRLDRQRPPSFPATNRFEVAQRADAWIEQEEHAAL